MDISEKISFDKINNNFDNGTIFFYFYSTIIYVFKDTKRL